VYYMPNLKEHEEKSLERYGKKFTELHMWMDAPVKVLGLHHRKLRHDLKQTPLEARQLFGENADNVCIDHIIMDIEESKTNKESRTRTVNTQMISIRLPLLMMKIVYELSRTTKKSMTGIIIEFLQKGIMHEHMINKLNDFVINQANLMLKLDWNIQASNTIFRRDGGRCRKCGLTTNLEEYQLPEELEEMSSIPNVSKITLCKNCINELEKYIPERHKIERFIEWFLEG